MREARGSKLLKYFDRYLGALLLKFVLCLLIVKGLSCIRRSREQNVYMLICIGAIGDLILLTEAARIQLRGKRVVLACSKLNLPCAQMYRDFYADIVVLDPCDVFDVHRTCMLYSVDVVYDSTQWANIVPLQVGVARFLDNGLIAVGFKTQSFVRNRVFNHVVNHGADVHEIVNFGNLFTGGSDLESNGFSLERLTQTYRQQRYKFTHKVLFHMWPSGTRSYLKEWPESYWAELSRYFFERGYVVYLSGSPVDKARNEKFIRKTGLNNLVNVAGGSELGRFSSFIVEEIECAICVNTGIMHLAASLGIPLIGLHGPTNPIRWGPLGVNSVSLVPQSGNFAYLHYGFEYPVDDDAAYALDRLAVDQVINAFEMLSVVDG